MLEFKTPEIDDKAWVDECFKYLKTMNCDYTFGNIFVWSTEYSTKISRFKDFFICSWGRGKETNRFPYHYQLEGALRRRRLQFPDRVYRGEHPDGECDPSA